LTLQPSYLEWLIKAENEGCNVKGYYAWSTTDCYSWINGYEKRYGLIYVDYANGLKRIPKKSYHWYREFIREHTED
jgi:6-phospho-beta-glucosidase